MADGIGFGRTVPLGFEQALSRVTEELAVRGHVHAELAFQRRRDVEIAAQAKERLQRVCNAL